MSSSIRQNSNFFRFLTVAFALAVAFAVALSLADRSTGAKARAAAAKKLPVITKVTPNAGLHVGDTITLSGRNFIKGKNTILVVFQREGGKRRFTARATGKSTTRATLKIPDVSGELAPIPAPTEQVPNPPAPETRFRLRAITKVGTSRVQTNRTISPLISRMQGDTGSSDTSADGDCDNDGIKNAADTDDDNDLLPDTTELSIATGVCNRDTDGDVSSDYYEYRVAFEYNGGPTLPYPAKMPYPNPIMDDGDQDFDNDGLTHPEEFLTWQYTGRMDRFYSDARADSDGDLRTDGSEDEDNDLLPNFTELRGFKDLNWIDTDTDGDGLCDGLDDQDHDGPPTPLSLADCASQVPNNGLTGDPNQTDTGSGDPSPTLIDGDDNISSNFFEWWEGTGVGNRALPDYADDAYDPCLPRSNYNADPNLGSPYCNVPWNPLPVPGP